MGLIFQVIIRAHFAILVALFTLASGLQIDYSRPIRAVNYSTWLGQGFSTNYFKSVTPQKKYNKANIQDVYNQGFRNLRLRCRSDPAEGFPTPNTIAFNKFLDDLEQVVNDCLEVGVFPVISWIHHTAEIHPNKIYRQQYIDWWVGVANRLKDKDYRLGFDLFTELGYTGCEGVKRCPDSIRENLDVYTNWTSSVVTAIRKLRGNNLKRILILASPGKESRKLYQIDETIYRNDDYMMAEWHLYASGPNKITGSSKFWSGSGSYTDKQRVRDSIAPAVKFTRDTGLPTYQGAWIPIDNINGGLNNREASSFGCYYARQLKANGIPWSMNVLDIFYNTKKSEWITDLQDIPRNSKRMLNMYQILKKVQKCM